MNIPALPLQTGEDEEGQTFEIIFSAKGWASPPTLHNRAAQGLDVRHLPSPSPCGRGEVFSLDIPFYRTRPRYIHRYPVKRELVEEPQHWPWSSFRHYLSGAEGVVEIE